MQHKKVCGEFVEIFARRRIAPIFAVPKISLMVEEQLLSAPVAELSLDDEKFWELEERGYTASEHSRMTALYETTLRTFTPNEIVAGTVVSFDDKEVVVNIGFKSEGVVPRTEFRDLAALKVGDTVEVYLEKIEDKDGQMIISRKLAHSVRTWEKIQSALDEDLIMEGIVKRRTKGGFVVDLQGIEAFLPGSQIDVKPIRDYDSYVNRRMEFKVVKINHQQRNVVISHKALIEKDLEAQKAEILNNLEKGQILEGNVKNITSFGVFVDLGGVDGLLHITDISWGRISSPDEVLHLDQKINIVVLDFDEEKKRISLGYKQLQPHPWENIPETIHVGAKVMGRVVTIADYGLFIEVLPGVEGLIHVSEMSWSQHPKNPYDIAKIGDEVEAVILTMDMEERKMSLGIKQLTTDPWELILQKYPVDSVHSVTVRNITNYGLFVELEEGVDGLIHIQDLSWSRKINHPSEFTTKDAVLDAMVLEVDKENHKLRLGIKQLTEDPWDTLETVFVFGSTHSGTITRLTDKGAVVELEYGIEGFAQSKQLKVAEGAEELAEGSKADFVVLEFSKDQKKIALSHTRTWQAETAEDAKAKKKGSRKGEESEASEADMAAANKSTEKETLGELSGLAKLRATLQAEETSAAPAAKSKAAKAAKAEAVVAEVEAIAAPEVETIATPEVVAEAPAEVAAVAPEAEEVVAEVKPKKKATKKAAAAEEAEAPAEEA
jgi:small subunit ribosomal protein S1